MPPVFFTIPSPRKNLQNNQNERRSVGPAIAMILAGQKTRADKMPAPSE
jgi:hypothetical protein